MQRTLVVIALLGGISLAPSAELKVFFGNLHSHTVYIDSSGTPDAAYQSALELAENDFLAITEHNHRSAEGSAVKKNDSIAHHQAP